MDYVMVIDMKLFERKCPQCGHNEFWFNNDDNEPQPLCIRDPYDDITFYVICKKCKCEFKYCYTYHKMIYTSAIHKL